MKTKDASQGPSTSTEGQVGFPGGQSLGDKGSLGTPHREHGRSKAPGSGREAGGSITLAQGWLLAPGRQARETREAPGARKRFSNSGGRGGPWLKYFPNKTSRRDFCCTCRFKGTLEMRFETEDFARPKHSAVSGDKKAEHLKLELREAQAVHSLDSERAAGLQEDDRYQEDEHTEQTAHPPDPPWAAPWLPRG